MNNIYEVKRLIQNDLSEVLDIFKLNYEKEVLNHESIPSYQEIYNEVSKSLIMMIDNHKGLAIIKNHKMVGYMIGIETGPLFGDNDGVVVPLHAHGALKEDKEHIYQILFNEAAATWVGNNIFSLAITIFAHDEQLKQLWFKNGFGMRCVDAIRTVELMNLSNKEFKVIKANQLDLSDIYHIHQEHNEYYRTSPIFMPNPDEDPKIDLDGWFKNEHRHIFIAYDANKAIGYVRIQEDGETFVSKHEKMMNITGAYVTSSYRNKGVASILLSEVMHWLKDNDYKYCGVDYESINPSGSAFWEKYFQAYTFSLTRRIDERIKTYTKIIK